jgi:hypothetical protein
MFFLVLFSATRAIHVHAALYQVTTILTPGIHPYHLAMQDLSGEKLLVADTSAAAIYIVPPLSGPGMLSELFAGQPGVHGWNDGHRIDPPAALLQAPTSLCTDPSNGHVFFLDRGPSHGPSSVMTSLLRMVDGRTGAVRTIAGSMNESGTRDGTGSDAVLSMGSMSLHCSPQGPLLLVDSSGAGSIRRVDCVGEDCTHPQPHDKVGEYARILWEFAWASSIFASGMILATVLIVKDRVREAIQRFRERGNGQNLISLIDE